MTSYSRFRNTCLLGMYAVLLVFGSSLNAEVPEWWLAGEPPVINTAATSNNYGVANVGQAKWVAWNALNALHAVLPDVAALVEADLVGAGKPIASWDAPTTQAEKDQQRAPLLLGQLKAISAPFYLHLHDVSPDWLASERTYYSMPNTGTFYPWVAAAPTDGSNKSPATIGQLKAVFSLDFAADRETGTNADGISDLWEYAHYGNLTQNGSLDSDHDGLTDLHEIQNGTNPSYPDHPALNLSFSIQAGLTP